MPIYEFECTQCGHRFDRLQKLSDADPTDCPTCGAAQVKRRLSAPSFRLAGSGWYETDFKKESDKKRNLAGDTGDSGKGDAGKNDGGKNDSGKNDSGKADTGKGDSGKNDSGKGDAGKGDPSARNDKASKADAPASAPASAPAPAASKPAASSD